MKRGLLTLLAVCAVAAAMIPRDRRAVSSAEEEEMRRTQSMTSTTSTAKPKEICAPQTPCAWATYRPLVKIIDFNFTNTYCTCGPDTVCQVNEDDQSVSAYIYRCRPPSAELDTIET